MRAGPGFGKYHRIATAAGANGTKIADAIFCEAGRLLRRQSHAAKTTDKE
jgi:hypothetical protein